MCGRVWKKMICVCGLSMEEDEIVEYVCGV